MADHNTSRWSHSTGELEEARKKGKKSRSITSSQYSGQSSSATPAVSIPAGEALDTILSSAEAARTRRRHGKKKAEQQEEEEATQPEYREVVTPTIKGDYVRWFDFDGTKMKAKYQKWGTSDDGAAFIFQDEISGVIYFMPTAVWAAMPSASKPGKR